MYSVLPGCCNRGARPDDSRSAHPMALFQRRQFIVEKLAGAGLYADRHDAERAHDDRQPFLLIARRFVQHGLIERGNQRIKATLPAIPVT